MSSGPEKRSQTKTSLNEVVIFGFAIGITFPTFLLPPFQEFLLQNFLIGGPVGVIFGISLGTALNFVSSAKNWKERVLVLFNLLFPCVMSYIVWNLISRLVT
jgi:hypothetical protein